MLVLPRLRSGPALLAGALSLGLLGTAAHGETGPAVPDFSGNWAKGGDRGSRYEQPESGPGPILNMSGDRHVPVGDYKNPILKPWAAAAIKAYGEELLAGRIAPEAHAMCMSMGVPYILQLRNIVQILQQPDSIAITYENNSEVRSVRLNARHSAHPVPSTLGESVGHYEGDVLVIDTIGIARREASSIDRFGTPHTDALHLIERYRVIDSGKTLRVDFTVEDPGTFTAPWSGWTSYPRVDPRRFGEFICAENNREAAAGHTRIPTATKADF